MIKSLNKTSNMEDVLDVIVAELEVRDEMGCSGNACGANGSACGVNC